MADDSNYLVEPITEEEAAALSLIVEAKLLVVEKKVRQRDQKFVDLIEKGSERPKKFTDRLQQIMKNIHNAR